MTVRITSIVNGTEISAVVAPSLLLSDFLRTELGLTGTHVGCEQGVCGACNVLLDGRAARSCLLLAAQVDGHEIVTTEGVSDELRRVFVEHGALQCGFCTPGFLVSLAELGDDRDALDEPGLREYLVGNLCRCTGYTPIIAAARDRTW